MKEDMTCPDCGEPTSIMKLGNEPPRRVCGRIGCDWDGITLRKPTPVCETTEAGAVVIE